MLAGVKVRMPGGMLVILLVEALGEGTALRLGGLGTNGSKRLKLALANRAVGFAGVEVDQCSGKGNSDCCWVRLSGLKVPGTLCGGISGRGCFSGLSVCFDKQG